MSARAAGTATDSMTRADITRLSNFTVARDIPMPVICCYTKVWEPVDTNMPCRHDHYRVYLPLSGIIIICLCLGCASRPPVQGSTTNRGVQSISPAARPGLVAAQATGITNSSAIITWTTDKSSTGIVEWGKTPDYGFTAKTEGDPAIQQSVTLTGLKPGTEYHFRIMLPDLSSARAIGPDQAFRTLEQLYISPLSISYAGISKVTGNTVTVRWITSAPATGRVEYGVTGLYGSSAAPDGAYLFDHLNDLGPLSPGTTYHYRVVSQDKNGNEAISTDQAFTMPGLSDSTATAIYDISVTDITHIGATVSWVTTGLGASLVEYSKDLSFGRATPPGTGKEHTVILDNLDNDTSYHFRIKATDSAGNISASQDMTFVTATAPRMQGFSPYSHNHCGCKGH